MQTENVTQDYLRFRKEYNIQKVIRNSVSYKESLYSRWTAYFVLIIILICLSLYFINTWNTEQETFEIYNKWYVYALLLNIPITYSLILYNKIVLYKKMKKSIPYYNQKGLSLLYSKINWGHLSIRNYWYEQITNIYSSIDSKIINFNNEIINEELRHKEKPSFPLTLNNISTWLSIISVILAAIIYCIDIKVIVGKEWNLALKLLAMVLLMLYPFFHLIIYLINEKYISRRDDYKAMQDYVTIMKYVLEKRQLSQHDKVQKGIITKLLEKLL
ncbi:hypothetical protein BAS10_06145 [Elizabethkingia meningoseptica]|uniref:hypothetical protein n=1 Tax=Elizabethkingia meningoseptica TaxID=238 RepID=UPI0009992E17|nr:hypothetical protein [Elizabethkingia meningoseptica]OPB98210.1 hypothetical protein BAS10_06145 [Elizabethkingia meningoseptica]